MHMKLWSEKLKARGHLGHLAVDGKIILKWIWLKKVGVNWTVQLNRLLLDPVLSQLNPIHTLCTYYWGT
jgi:hypothetical protein